jgi:hypothetical protein
MKSTRRETEVRGKDLNPMERGRENKYANETNIAEVTKNQI